MNEPTTTFAGNLAADPDLAYTPPGRAVANLTVICNPRRQDATGQWIDGTPVFWRCELWGGLAENAADSLHKGNHVVVAGRIKTNTWTPSDGPNAGVEQRRLQVVVDELGASLRFASLKVMRADRRDASHSAPTEAAAPSPSEPTF